MNNDNKTWTYSNVGLIVRLSNNGSNSISSFIVLIDLRKPSIKKTLVHKNYKLK